MLSDAKMTIEIVCTCGARYQVQPQVLGQVVQCQSCGAQFVASAPAAPLDSLTPLPAQPPAPNTGMDPLAGDDLSYLEQAGATDYATLAASAAQQPQQRPKKSAGLRVWRDGNRLVVCRESKLPYRCVRTNAPVDDM